MLLISYVGQDEALVCTEEQEETLLKEFFEEGGRNVDDYDRVETDDIVQITTNLSLLIAN